MTSESLAGPGSPSSLRTANQKRVLASIIDAGGLSQAEIARRTGLAPATVSNIVRELTEAGVLRLAEAASGRRGNTIAFAPNLGYAVGVSIERKQVRVGIVTLDHTIVDSQILPMPPGFSAEEGQKKAVDLFDSMMAQKGLSNSQIVAGCIVVANAVRQDGRLASVTSMNPLLTGLNLESRAQSISPFPILTENNANAGALAEHTWGAARGIDNFVYVEVSHGIGAGIMSGGEILYGAGGIAGEIGHLPIPGHHELCKCGSTGCLEQVASVSSIMESLRGLGLPVHTLTDFYHQIEDNNIIMQRRIREAGYALGYVLAQICNILNPQMIVIGGLLSQAGDILTDQIRYTIDNLALPDSAKDVEVCLSPLGFSAPLRGAMAKAVATADLDAILQKYLSESPA